MDGPERRECGRVGGGGAFQLWAEPGRHVKTGLLEENLALEL